MQIHKGVVMSICGTIKVLKRLGLPPTLWIAASLVVNAKELSVIDVDKIGFAEVQLEMLCGSSRTPCRVVLGRDALRIDESILIPYKSISEVLSEAHTQCGSDREIRNPYLVLSQGNCVSLYTLISYQSGDGEQVGLFTALKRSTYDAFVVNLFLRKNSRP